MRLAAAPSAPRAAPRLPPAAIPLGLAALAVALGALLPLALLAARGVTALSPALPVMGPAVLRTLLLGGAAASVATVAGTASALALRGSVPGRRALQVTLALPAAVPPYVLALGWIALLAPGGGLLTRVLAIAGLEGPSPYGFAPLALVLGAALAPYPHLSVAAALARIDPALEEAARICGASRARVLRDVTLPLAAPGLAAGFALSFAYASAAYGVPSLLALSGRDPFHVLTTRAAAAVLSGGAEGLATAAALSLPLAGIAGFAALVAGRLARRAGPGVAGGAARSAHSRSRAERLQAGAIGWGIAAVTVIPPALATLLAALAPRWGDLPLPPTARHLAELLSPFVAAALLRSLLLGAGTALLVVLLGTLLAAVRRGRTAPVARAIAAVGSAPYALPGTALAIGLLLAWSREVRVVILERVTVHVLVGGTLGMLAIAYAVKHLAIGVRSAQAGLARLDPSLEEAARTCGASPLRAFADAALPLLRRDLAAAFLLAFLAGFTELTMSVLLVAPGTETLGTVLFERLSYGDPPGAAALALVAAAPLAAAALLARLTSEGA